ncbi:TPA: hypothetical protein OPR08_002019 [Citrobacter koseri]|uniref:WD40/YVTN/BNR-like repeat-containing protein n=1 Tax=Citrobacter koseri TaxID=545 RepID=UPI002AB3CDCA|nr:hypothetical protein [Citrobacter koseri]HCR9769216.1 hypothetical protein [Citrobacter koseri]HEM6800234.1 hypothetical protein [Citrobacter koseri]HEM7948789.1 hypothetical protein [Citrobacter koseri]
MIINKEAWEKYFKGFDVYDCTYGYEHGRVGLALIELVEEEHDEYENPFYTPEKRLISIAINNPPEQRIYGRRAKGISLMTISSGWSPSNNEYVMASQGRAVVSYKEDEYKGRENDIDIPIPGANDMFSAIARLVRVGTSVYAIGSGFRVYKRINHQIWQEYSQSIPIPEGLTERKVEALTTSFFEDMAGFSESDIYAVGGTGIIYHFDGDKWKQLAFPTNKLLYTVCCAGDGFVYIADFDGAVWKGRNEQWEKIIHGGMSMPFLNMAWFDGRLWCASDYGIWVLEEGKMVLAMYAKHKPVPSEVAVLSKRIDVSPDGTVMMVCGARGAAIYDGNEWNVLFDSLEFE